MKLRFWPRRQRTAQHGVPVHAGPAQHGHTAPLYQPGLATAPAAMPLDRRWQPQPDEPTAAHDQGDWEWAHAGTEPTAQFPRQVPGGPHRREHRHLADPQPPVDGPTRADEDTTAIDPAELAPAVLFEALGAPQLPPDIAVNDLGAITIGWRRGADGGWEVAA